MMSQAEAQNYLIQFYLSAEAEAFIADIQDEDDSDLWKIQNYIRQTLGQQVVTALDLEPVIQVIVPMPSSEREYDPTVFDNHDYFIEVDVLEDLRSFVHAASLSWKGGGFMIFIANGNPAPRNFIEFTVGEILCRQLPPLE